jgi:hypothetical protein
MGLHVGNIDNGFLINFIGSNCHPWKSIIDYGSPDKSKDKYEINTKRENPRFINCKLLSTFYLQVFS